jgi:hypothetical protein
VSSHNSSYIHNEDRFASSEGLAHLRLQLMDLSPLEERRGSNDPLRKYPLHAPTPSRPVYLDDYIAPVTVSSTPSHPVYLDDYIAPVNASVTSCPVDLDDYVDEVETSIDTFAPVCMDGPVDVDNYFHAPVCVDDSGPVDVDDYLVEQSSSSDDSLFSFEGSLVEEETEFDRGLIGYEEGFEPPVDKDASFLFPPRSHPAHHVPPSPQKWNNKSLHSTKMRSDAPSIHSKSCSVSTKSTLFEC